MNLEKNYNRDDFLLFLKSFVPKFSKDIRHVATNGLQVTKEVFYLGESAELNLSVFELTHSSSADARVALAMDGFKVMKNSATYRALVIYRADNGEDWRLSLMTAAPGVNQKGKVSQVFSNPRRFSFFLGPNAKVNTPYQFLIKQGAVKDFAELQKRFSLEVVNKEFYKQISENFIKLVGGTLGSGKNKKTHKTILKLPSVPDQSQVSLEFAVRLIGRVIFCWFLREKKSPTLVNLMPKELLSLEAVAKHPDYYHQILESIFFEVLNKESKSRGEPYSSGSFSLIPYLNGGLFSPHEDDYYKRRNGEQSLYHNTLVVPDEWFVDFFKTLEIYNFTIDENTSFDEELSIDPEMLGRIFENLLAEINPETGESARKSTGSFYTPRAIVDYMVDESLFLYLKQQTNIEEKMLRALISYDLGDDSRYPLSQSEKQKVIDALEKLKLLDPACGSGAFPIGALQKIVFILQQIDLDGQLWFKTQIKKASPEIRRVIEREFSHKNFDYIRKLGVIRENIYGVDIQPIATEISRLRCFLTLVVDERVDDSLTNRGIEPLPNLDFKFVTANSLIGLPTNHQTTLFNDQDGIDQLKDLRNQFFNATNSERYQLKDEFKEIQKRMLLRMIETRSGDDITQKLSAWNPFNNKASSWFDSEWMFGIQGFDVVIGNPPYGVSLKGQNRVVVTESLGKVPDYEIYYYFIELANKVLVQDGINSYIIPNTILFNVFATEYRKKILDSWRINIIIDCTAFKFFESATVYNAITVFSKSTDSKLVGYKNTLEAESFGDLLKRDTLYISKDELLLNNVNWGLVFKLPQGTSKIIKKIKSNPKKARNIFEISQGYIPYRRSDLIKKYGKEHGDKIVDERVWHSETKDSSEHIREIHGKSLSKFFYRRANSFFKYGKHVASYVDEKFFKQRRLLIREITNPSIIASIVEEDAVNDPQIINVINNDSNRDRLSFFCGILNSKLATFYHFNASPKASKGAFPKILIIDIKDFPFPNFDTPEKEKTVTQIEFLVNKVLAEKKSDPTINTTALERQIDQLVYKLYALTPEEIEIVENSTKE